VPDYFQAHHQILNNVINPGHLLVMQMVAHLFMLCQLKFHQQAMQNKGLKKVGMVKEVE
jgi:hypothetical protein